MISAAVRDYENKHRSALALASTVATTCDYPKDQIKSLGFSVPRSVAYTGQLRQRLPTVPGFLLTTGLVHDSGSLNVSNASFVSSGPFARTLLLALPSGVVVSGSEDYYRPLTTSDSRITNGIVTWPIEQTYDIPVLQQVGTDANVNFGSLATALSLPGSVMTCAVSGTDPSSNNLLSLATSPIAPTGSWNAALGPVMASPSFRRSEVFGWRGYLTTGDYSMASSPGAPFLHVPTNWNVGSYPSFTMTGTPGGSQVMCSIDRHPTVLSSPHLKRFLLPMGTPGKLTLTVRMVGVHNAAALSPNTGVGTGDFDFGFGVTFSIPQVSSSGAQTLSTLSYNNITKANYAMVSGGGTNQTPDTWTLTVVVPPFAVDATLSYYWGPSNNVTGTFAGGQVTFAAVNALLEHEQAVLRPALAAYGMGSNSVTTLTLGSVIVTESTPQNALLLGTCSVSPATEEMLSDIEGVMGSLYQRQSFLSPPTSVTVAELMPSEVTPSMEPVATPTKSGTFVFPLLSSVAAPLLSKLVGKGVDLAKEHLLPAAARAIAGPEKADGTEAMMREILNMLKELRKTPAAPAETAILNIPAKRLEKALKDEERYKKRKAEKKETQGVKDTAAAAPAAAQGPNKKNDNK